jgi:hypothetical protein
MIESELLWPRGGRCVLKTTSSRQIVSWLSNDPWHDSSFCFYGDEEIVHIESERFTRVKYEAFNPILISLRPLPAGATDRS